MSEGEARVRAIIRNIPRTFEYFCFMLTISPNKAHGARCIAPLISLISACTVQWDTAFTKNFLGQTLTYTVQLKKYYHIVHEVRAQVS